MAVRDTVGDLPPLPANVWAAGSVVLLLFGTVRALRLRRYLTAALPATEAVRQMVSGASAALGLRRIPETLMVDSRISPMIWCGRRTKLILPEELWTQLDNTGRRAVVFHELAHLRRRDHWVFWAELLVGVLYWWHPLVWWVRGRLHREAELCCDAWVTSLLPHGRRAYAEALLLTKRYTGDDFRWMPGMGIGMSVGRARRFARRITMIMTQSAKPGLSVSGTLLALAVAGVGWLAAPAKSCPPKERRVEAGEPPAAMVALAGCAKCKRGEPCEHCSAAISGDHECCGKCCADYGCKCCKKHRRAHAGKWSDCCNKAGRGVGCKHCATGKGIWRCKSCKQGKPCKKCRMLSSAGREARNVFEEHLARKMKGLAASEGLFEGMNPLVTALLGAAETRAGLTNHDDDEDDDELEERLERLEEELERLNRRLSEMADSLSYRDRGPGPDFRAPRTPRAPRAPRPPRPPRAPRFGAPPPPPIPGPEHRPEGPARGRSVIRSYKLPDGIREALTALMVRDDVPVLVRPLPDGIEVHGTPRQQRVFAMFVRLIHPSGHKQSKGRPDLGETPEAGDRFPGFDEYREHPAGNLERAARVRAEAIETAAETRHQMEMQKDRLRRLDAERDELEAEMRRLEEEADTLRMQAAEHRDRAEELGDRADELRRRTDELREEAEELRERAESEDDEQEAEEFLETSKARRRQARELDIQARRVERKSGQANREAEALERAAERVERQAERLEARAEQLEEERNELQERLEILRKAADQAGSKAHEQDL